MEEYLTVSDISRILKISPGTIYRNPHRYNMFKVGGVWRANKESLENFSRNVNNAIRLAVVGKESRKCRSTGEGKRIGLTYQRQMGKELGDLLAPRKDQRRKSITTS
ncbi:helix-turn-helix domain-containing protein [Pectobacterium carotovorum]|uniref:helix-turn-helix domain-containing protein n=1 Tax=Pectobacterium carotovorum TaxID=554 RepID=UPI00215B1545|nr:helix-turn-helix domain-containing protein [Pectobacterium carotovorum]